MSRTFRYATAGILSWGVLFLCGCPNQTFSIDPGISQQEGWSIKAHYEVNWDPPGSYLTGFDASQALLNLSLSNATISSTSGTVIVSVKDLTTGQIVGQQSFGYVVRGNSLFAQEPTAVYNWLQQFTGYSSIDVIAGADADLQATSAGTASATGNAQYQGVTYGSGTVSWATAPTDGGGGCSTPICPNQN